jgi:hypothetical protein
VAERKKPKLTKLHAVQQAIDAGKADDPEGGLLWIEAQLGLKMSRAMFSSYKSRLLRAGKAKKTKRVRPQLAVTTSNGHGAELTEQVQLALGLRAAIDKHGVETVRNILQLVAKA